MASTIDAPVRWESAETIAAAPVEIGCINDGGATWCQARARIDADRDALAAILSDLSGYEQVFPRVSRSEELAPGVAHVVLDLPAPLADRDYVARFSQSLDGETAVLAWRAADWPVPEVDGAIRLDRTAGVWRLTPDGDGGTEIVYIWQAELGGEVPGWALPRIRTAQGREVLKYLAAAAGGALSPIP